MAYTVNESDRRPIAARRSAKAHAVARWLARRQVSPNAISIAGMVFATLGAVCLFVTAHTGTVAARALFVVAALAAVLRLLANLFDGMVAVERSVASPLGELYNDVPDRVSDAALLVGAGYAATGDPALGWAAALVALFVAYVRACGKAGGAPQIFAGPMAKPQRMWLLVAVCLYCAAVPAPWQSLTLGGRAVGAVSIALAVMILGGMITAARRLLLIARALRAPHA